MFVQVIEGRVKDAQAMLDRGDQWQTELRPGAAGFRGVTGGATADGRFIMVVRFESEAAARANSERPEQSAWWADTAGLFDGDISFAESGDVTEWMGGGSDDAGFVQVMKSTGVDRAQVERMDAVFEAHGAVRPDVLGGQRIWTGPDSCIDVAYFTSEADARDGEKTEMPDEVKELMADVDGMGDTEYLDLSQPQIR